VHLSKADAALLQDIEAAIAAGAKYTPQQVAAAEALAAGVGHLMRSAINRDLILVTPIVPAAPIRLDAPVEQQAAFLRRSQQFAALAALAGLPSVTLPVGLLRDGAPLSVALCAQPKSDQRLLDVACALMPHVRVSGCVVAACLPACLLVRLAEQPTCVHLQSLPALRIDLVQLMTCAVLCCA
jgi:Asp-tRNA(Asn)/Glu-tRNA(Gln) amidotransferase A subunit family amidase